MRIIRLTQSGFNQLCVDGYLFLAGFSLFVINRLTISQFLCVYEDEYTKDLSIEKIQIINE